MDDVQAYIVGFCNAKQCHALYNTSKHTRYIVSRARLYYHGPINGSQFSIETFRMHGAVWMPYISVVDITGMPAGFSYDFLNLKLLMRRRALTLVANTVPEALARLPWDTIDLQASDSCESFRLRANTVKASLPAFSCLDIECTTLELSNRHFTATSAAFEKALSIKGLKSLTLFGRFYNDDAIANVNAMAPDLETLVIVTGGSLDWYNVHFLQRMCPNLRHLTIQSCNLLDLDFKYFQWHLWPNLESLNVEDNHTLRGHPRWPPTLTTLRAANTGLKGLTWIPPGLHTLSLDLHYDMVQVIGNLGLKRLEAYMTTYYKPVPWPKFPELYVKFKEYWTDF